jgi:serine/threonine-protein kinase
MATVYLARDRESNTEVAVKVLHPELAAMLGPDRFQQEIDLLGRLHHPGILPLLTAHQSESLFYYTTPFVAGESLRDRLAREKQLQLQEALHIAREVAAALDYAHARNILHRDVKPDNVLLDRKKVLLCDFGVARAIERAGGESISSSGLIVGTPEYMSPEQADGRRELDARSDLYSLGVMIYEMLAGGVPFTGPTAQVVFARQMREPPPPIRPVCPEVSAELEAVLMRLLSKDPARRPATGAELTGLLASV